MIDISIHKRLREQFNPDGSELRRRQLVMLGILREIDRICRNNDIDYWLSSGTLLGAVRHGGFIPWDDDVDIEMTKADYKRFLSVAPAELPDYMKIQNSHTDPMFMLSFSKVRDTRTVTKEAGTCIDSNYRYSGYFIDVFPMEPSTSGVVHYLHGKLAYYGIIAVNKSHNSLGGKIVRSLYGAMSALCGGISAAVQRINPGERLRHVSPSTFQAPRMKSELFPTSEVNFEGYRFKAPHDCHKYLTRLFGDYMRLPDITDVRSHLE